MATSSIYGAVNITTKAQANKLVLALEKAEKHPVKKKKSEHAHETIGGEDVKKFFEEQHE